MPRAHTTVSPPSHPPAALFSPQKALSVVHVGNMTLCVTARPIAAELMPAHIVSRSVPWREPGARRRRAPCFRGCRYPSHPAHVLVRPTLGSLVLAPPCRAPDQITMTIRRRGEGVAAAGRPSMQATGKRAAALPQSCASTVSQGTSPIASARVSLACRRQVLAVLAVIAAAASALSCPCPQPAAACRGCPPLPIGAGSLALDAEEIRWRRQLHLEPCACCRSYPRLRGGSSWLGEERGERKSAPDCPTHRRNTLWR